MRDNQTGIDGLKLFQQAAHFRSLHKHFPQTARSEVLNHRSDRPRINPQITRSNPIAGHIKRINKTKLLQQ